MEERTYWSAEVAQALGVATVTLRKWSLLFEAAGHTFLRDAAGRRAYTEKDVAMWKRFAQLNQDMRLEEAVEQCLQDLEQDREQPSEPYPLILRDLEERLERYETRVTGLENALEQMIQMHQDLEKRQASRDLEREKREEARDQQLVATLRSLMENASEEAAKKKKRWRFF
ncbi:hypothetical protein [Alicyclobacillus sp. SP_1]|jgi:DNA-binding transcriptional MerR regulator|uniref:helix-turn-helix domain-containing protein n=1 Tax=Alicyclobacillus sp. SP_1 TaxID=2942475 RepID=UPI0021586D90|nr:hypothetical protein [Alicyclobacillus sp. SP_1]